MLLLLDVHPVPRLPPLQHARLLCHLDHQRLNPRCPPITTHVEHSMHYPYWPAVRPLSFSTRRHGENVPSSSSSGYFRRRSDHLSRGTCVPWNSLREITPVAGLDAPQHSHPVSANMPGTFLQKPALLAEHRSDRRAVTPKTLHRTGHSANCDREPGETVAQTWIRRCSPLTSSLSFSRAEPHWHRRRALSSPRLTAHESDKVRWISAPDVHSMRRYASDRISAKTAFIYRALFARRVIEPREAGVNSRFLPCTVSNARSCRLMPRQRATWRGVHAHTLICNICTYSYRCRYR